MTSPYQVDRSGNCFFFRNAVDAPIEITFHHYALQVVIINQETGDVLTQSFSDSREGADAYFKHSRRKLMQDTFLEDGGPYTFFVLESNANVTKPDIEAYLDDLRAKGITDGGVLSADITVLPENEYANARRGEIPTSFSLDLGQIPPTAQPYYYEDSGQPAWCEPLDMYPLEWVMNRASNVPDMDDVIDQYWEYANIATLLFRADTEGLEKLFSDDYAPDINRLFYLDDRVGQAVQEHMQDINVCFSNNYLYDEDKIHRIIDTLHFVQNHGTETQHVALLANEAAQRLGNRLVGYLYHTDNMPPDHLIEYSRNLLQFGIGLVANEPDPMLQDAAAEIMRGSFGRVYGLLLQLSTSLPDISAITGKLPPGANHDGSGHLGDVGGRGTYLG